MFDGILFLHEKWYGYKISDLDIDALGLFNCFQLLILHMKIVFGDPIVLEYFRSGYIFK